MFNKEECPHCKEGIYNHECTIAEKYGYSNRCDENDHNSCWGDKICFMREKYCKEHPKEYIQFGKYKYREYTSIPNDYLAWLLKQELRPELREIIEDAVIKKNREDIITTFINENYTTHRYHKRSSYNPRGYGDYCPPDMDYGGDLFDAMQGCGINGD